ncbi:MAG: hypothetical protein AB1705_08175 [Verrucomicrobiota bacterium]
MSSDRLKKAVVGACGGILLSMLGSQLSHAAAPDPKQAAPTAKGAPAAAGAKTNAPPKEVVIPKSYFTVDNKLGLDPFYPRSERWRPPPPKPVVPVVQPGQPVVAQPGQPPSPPPPPPDPWKGFSLKGITGTVARRFALISTAGKNYDFMTGESLKVKTELGDKSIKCVEITDRQVTFSMEGEKENKTFRVP